MIFFVSTAYKLSIFNYNIICLTQLKMKRKLLSTTEIYYISNRYMGINIFMYYEIKQKKYLDMLLHYIFKYIVL